MMKVVINGTAVIGIEEHVCKAIVNSLCGRCMHNTIAHTDAGCTIAECICKKGYTTYLLLQDEDFIEEIKKEGLF